MHPIVSSLIRNTLMHDTDSNITVFETFQYFEITYAFILEQHISQTIRGTFLTNGFDEALAIHLC